MLEVTQAGQVAAWRLYKRASSTDSWQELRTQSAQNFTKPNKPPPGAYYLQRISRALMPAFGIADFYFSLGDIDELKWTPETAADLLHQEIRIDVAYDDVDDGAPSSGWYVAFWGICEEQTDGLSPAASFTTADDISRGFTSAGRRQYRCLDLTAVLRRRYMYQHAYEESGGTVRLGVRGVAGFNASATHTYAQPQTYANRGATEQTADNGVTYYPHALPTPSALVWTDQQVAEALIGAHVNESDPAFTITDDSSLLAGVQGWVFGEGMPIRDALGMIFDRRRGKGAVYLDWDSGVDIGTGATDLAPVLRVVPQTLDDITLGGALGTQDGATTAGTDIAITLTGDHRVIDSSYALGGPSAFTVDYVETVGERIQVLVSLGYPDSTLEERWSSANATEVDNGNELTAEQPQLAHVYRLHGLPFDWDGAAGNGNAAGSPASNDYECHYSVDDDGTILVPKESQVPPLSPLSVRFLPDCPFHQGIDISDGSTETDAEARKDTPGRLPLAVYNRTDDDTYAHTIDQLSVQASEHTLTIRGKSGANRIGSPSGSVPYTQMVVRCGIELPNRVRMATGDPQGERKMQIHVPDTHLWIGHEGSMVGIDTDGSGVRIGSQYVVYRDDRDVIYRRHALAEAWYLRSRRALTYSMRTCGLTQFDEGGEGTTEWPRIGQVVSTVNASSIEYDVATPISSVIYDHQQGITTWATDWMELDS